MHIPTLIELLREIEPQNTSGMNVIMYTLDEHGNRTPVQDFEVVENDKGKSELVVHI